MAYVRKTVDVFDIEGRYAHSWEAVTSEETWKDARAQVRAYRENEPDTAFRIRKYRKRIPWFA